MRAYRRISDLSEPPTGRIVVPPPGHPVPPNVEGYLLQLESLAAKAQAVVVDARRRRVLGGFVVQEDELVDLLRALREIREPRHGDLAGHPSLLLGAPGSDFPRSGASTR